MIDIQQFDINEPISSKSAKPKNYLRLLIYTRSNPRLKDNRLLHLAGIPIFLIMVLVGLITGHAVLQIIPLFIK